MPQHLESPKEVIATVKLGWTSKEIVNRDRNEKVVFSDYLVLIIGRNGFEVAARLKYVTVKAASAIADSISIDRDVPTRLMCELTEEAARQLTLGFPW